jgi:pimeloyl-ACP methyl ester carboxylesterase
VIRSADGTSIALTVRGVGPPVLLGNGAGEPATQWDGVLVEPLLAAGCTVVTWDYRGVAPSGDPARPATMDDMVADAEAVLEAATGGALDGTRRPGPAVAVGYSSGGWVATALAARRPDLVAAVSTIAGIGPAPAVERAWLDEVLARGGAAEAGAPIRASVAHWRAWEEWVDADPAVHLDALADLRQPVQVVAFAEDPYLTPAMAGTAAGRLAHGELTVVDGCGHTGLWDRSDLVVPLVVGFVTRPRRTGPPAHPPR